MKRPILTLKLNKEFKRLYYRGSNQVHPFLVTYAKRNSLGVNRIGITTTKKLGGATVRNRARRVIRESYRSLMPTLPAGWDFVFVARYKTAGLKSTQLLPVMEKQIEKAIHNNKNGRNPSKKS